jgi:hypothetical protein
MDATSHPFASGLRVQGLPCSHRTGMQGQEAPSGGTGPRASHSFFCTGSGASRYHVGREPAARLRRSTSRSSPSRSRCSRSDSNRGGSSCAYVAHSRGHRAGQPYLVCPAASRVGSRHRAATGRGPPATAQEIALMPRRRRIAKPRREEGLTPAQDEELALGFVFFGDSRRTGGSSPPAGTRTHSRHTSAPRFASKRSCSGARPIYTARRRSHPTRKEARHGETKEAAGTRIGSAGSVHRPTIPRNRTHPPFKRVERSAPV